MKRRIKLKESDLTRLVKRLIKEEDGNNLPKLNPQLGDESYLKKLITSMNSVDEFTSWFDKTYGPYREAGANIPMGREVISIQEGTQRRLNEKMPWWQIVGGIFSMITAAVKAWESVQHLCCNQEPKWSCCTSGGESTGSGTSPIKLKESNLTRLVKKLINEQSTPTGKPIAAKSCGDPGGMAYGSSRRVLVNDNGTLRDPLVGDTWCVGSPNSYYTQHGCNSEILYVQSSCDGCAPPIGTGTGNCGVQCYKTPRTITTLTNGCSDP